MTGASVNYNSVGFLTIGVILRLRTTKCDAPVLRTGCGWSSIMSDSKENQDLVPVSRSKWQIPPSIQGLVKGEEGRERGLGPLLLTAKQAASMCSKSLRTWRTWDAAGWIPRPVRIGRSTLWRADELRDWVARGCPRREEWEAK